MKAKEVVLINEAKTKKISKVMVKLSGHEKGTNEEEYRQAIIVQTD